VYKVQANNIIKFTKDKNWKGSYPLTKNQITKYPIESNGSIPCYCVSLDELVDSEWSEQLTSNTICKRKNTYWSYEIAARAKKRRNKSAGINYLRAYKCNLGEHWHLTTERKDPLTITEEE